jgi:hypothetical protein
VETRNAARPRSAPSRGTHHTAGSPLPVDAMTPPPPKRILRSGEEERDMTSDADEAVKADKGRFAKPRAMGCAVVIAAVLAIILAWVLGFFAWLSG